MQKLIISKSDKEICKKLKLIRSKMKKKIKLYNKEMERHMK